MSIVWDGIPILLLFRRMPSGFKICSDRFDRFDHFMQTVNMVNMVMAFFRHCLHFFALHFLHFLHFQDVSLFRIMLVFSRLCLIVQIVQIVQCHFFMHHPSLEPFGAPANFNLWGERRQWSHLPFSGAVWPLRSICRTRSLYVLSHS